MTSIRLFRLGFLTALGVFSAGLVITRPGESADAASNATFSCSIASIIDGDTLRCQETEADGRQIRVRLSGISARERDGSCSVGHPCSAASSEAATAALDRLVSGQVLQCEQVGETYGRRAAFCYRQDGTDVSCSMVASGTVAVWDRYMEGHRC